MYFFMPSSQSTTPSSTGRLSAMPLDRLLAEKQSGKYKCFFCINVRTATMAMGTYHLMLQTLCAVILLTAAMQRPSAYALHAWHTRRGHAEQSTSVHSEQPYRSDVIVGVDAEARPINLTGDRFDVYDSPRLPDTPLYHMKYVQEYTEGLNRGDLQLAMACVLLFMSITVALLYGVLYRRPLCILPFFAFQVFDFVVSALTAVGHYRWLPALERAIENSTKRLTPTAAAWAGMALFVACVAVMMVKAYMLMVVWSCYNYTVVLASLAGNQQTRFAGHVNDERLLSGWTVAPGKPPAYDTCAATGEELPPPYVSTVEVDREVL